MYTRVTSSNWKPSVLVTETRENSEHFGGFVLARTLLSYEAILNADAFGSTRYAPNAERKKERREDIVSGGEIRKG